MSGDIKKKIVVFTLLLICVVWFSCAFSRYIYSYPGIEGIAKFFNEFYIAILKPVWNEMTPKVILLGVGIYLAVYTYIITYPKADMPGKEFGSAEFADPKKITDKLSDKKDDSNNKILSKNVKTTYDGRKSGLNNNTLIVGGSGAGKTRFTLKPNVLQLHDCMVITDADGGTLRDMGDFLREQKYDIKVLNLVDYENSNRYNPFKYIHSEMDIIRLVRNIVKSTTPPDSQKDNPFWEQSFAMLMNALIYYIWDKGQPEEQNFNTLLTMLDYAKPPIDASGNVKKSALDILFDALEEEEPRHKSVIGYRKVMDGADETVRSILQTVHSKLEYFKIDEIRNILSGNEIDFTTMAKKKTAIFCVIPDDDDSLNFLISMFYLQMFQELYRQAKASPKERLDLDVMLWLDEFANTGFTDNFPAILATVRKYGISCAIYLQSIAQLKAKFKDSWEGIVDNCDTYVYLGGNSKTTFKDISERLGKKTIRKLSQSINKGSHSSNGINADGTGREMMTEDEVGLIPNKKCLVFVRGHRPVYDFKYDYTKHPMYKYTGEAKGRKYIHKPIRVSSISDFNHDNFEIVNLKAN